MSNAPPAPIGVVGHYNLLERLEPAGPGELFRARDTRLGRTVAVRLLPVEFASEAGERAELLERAGALIALSHHNTTALFEVGEHEGRVYLVFEFQVGQTLRAEMAGRQMKVRRAIEVAVQIADAVSDAHAAGFVHGGLSPDSIVITAKGHAKIPAFELASRAGFEPNTAEARLHDYDAPEEAKGEEADERSDVYSVGAILYEMLTTRRPLHRGSAAPSAANGHVPRRTGPCRPESGRSESRLPFSERGSACRGAESDRRIFSIRATWPETRTSDPQRLRAGFPWTLTLVVMFCWRLVCWLGGSWRSEDLAELLGERGAGQHFVDACAAGRTDHVGLDVRDVAERRDTTQRRIGLQVSDHLERPQLRAVQVEDHQRRHLFSNARHDLLRRALEEHLGAERFGGGRDLDREDQVVHGAEDHRCRVTGTREMILEIREAPPFHKNGFVVGCERTREAIVVDPGDEVDELLAAVTTHRLDVRHILLTHAHIDHITGVAAAKSALVAPVYLHRDDLPLYEHAVEQGRMFGFRVEQPPPVDRFYDQDPIRSETTKSACTIPLGTARGVSACRWGRRARPVTHLLVGDTLFAGSIGRTDLPGGNYGVLMRSITEVLFALGDDAIVHPGHGPDTTIGLERRTNPFVLEYLQGR